MPLTLRDALIPGWLQVTGSVRALVEGGFRVAAVLTVAHA